MISQQFLPFDRVLVRNSVDEKWCIDFFSHIDEDRGFICTSGNDWVYCISYEGNERLCGTTISLYPPRWRAEKGEIYYYIATNCIICNVMDTRDGLDSENYSIGNYFRTKEEAQAMANEFLLILKENNYGTKTCNS